MIQSQLGRGHAIPIFWETSEGPSFTVFFGIPKKSRVAFPLSGKARQWIMDAVTAKWPKNSPPRSGQSSKTGNAAAGCTEPDGRDGEAES